MRSAILTAFTSALTLGWAAPAIAQGEAPRVRASRRDTIVAAATVTAAFTITNASADSAIVTPVVETPADWTVLMGASAVTIAPRSAEMTMLSVVVPSRAAAGVHAIRLSVPGGGGDSIMVRVPRRRALEAGLLDRPGFVVSGKAYEVTFLVRNRGNLHAIVRLAARSTMGPAVLADTLFDLPAEESRIVRVHVRTPAGLSAATDDVLEISATQFGDPGEPTHASARVTVVPEPSRKIEEYLRVPTQVNVRATNTDAVSPFEVFGRGFLTDGGTTEVDFLLRGPTGEFSAFGERDEYRLSLRAPGWSLRLGDNIYMLTPLTGGAQPGAGAALEGTRGILGGGVYGQEFRRVPVKGTEAGAFVSARVREDSRLALHFVSRHEGLLPGEVGSATAAIARGRFSASGEVARSRSASGPGLARSARVSGASGAYSFDVGHQHADTAFSGAQRGAEHSYLTASSHHLKHVSFAANGGAHRSDLSRSTGVPYVDRMRVGALAATLFGRYTVELGALERSTTVSGATMGGRQHGVRTRGDQETAFGLVSLEAEAGQARDAQFGSRAYTDLAVSARRALPAGGLGVWAERYSGGSVTKGSAPTVTLGGDASMRLSRTVDVTFMGFATRVRTTGGGWHSQVDALLSHSLPNGSRVSLRARMLGGGTLDRSDQSVAYLEYGIPLRLPVSRLRTPGRVYGQVVDAVTGRGVPGALVRLGPQVAITDGQGQVAFGGVPGGQHRLSMSQETSFADAVFVGDPTLLVDTARTSPTTFRLAIARSARLRIDVRRFVTARTGVAGAPDSLADAGPLANATLVLAGERDTLYRTTKADGLASFTDVPPGVWVVFVRGDMPAFHRFDPDRAEVTVAPGETKALSFRLVPRRREVQLIGDGQELRNEAADVKPAPGAAPTTRTRKPDENRPHEKRPNDERTDHTGQS